VPGVRAGGTSGIVPGGGVASGASVRRGRVLRPLEGVGEQPFDLVDGGRDEAGVAGRRLVWPDGRRCLGIGAASELGGGDGADGEGGHHQVTFAPAASVSTNDDATRST
jgi:hypothetical protein